MLSFVLSFLVSAPKTTVIILIPSRLTDVTKHLLAPFVKPVFTPFTPYRFPNNSFVLVKVLLLSLIEIVILLVLTILANFSMFKA